MDISKTKSERLTFPNYQISKKLKPKLTQPNLTKVSRATFSVALLEGKPPQTPPNQDIQSYVLFRDLEIWKSEILHLVKDGNKFKYKVLKYSCLTI